MGLSEYLQVGATDVESLYESGREFEVLLWVDY